MGTPAPSNPARTAALVTIVSGVVLAISSFLEWAGIEGVISVKGTDGSDGWITLVCGLIGVAAGGMVYSAAPTGKLQGILAIVAGAIGAAIGLINYSDADGFQSFGLYLVILGGVGLIVGGVLLLRSRTDTAGVVGPPPGDAPPPGGPPTA